ncbi:hypothetical protein C8R43DRAFT_1147791 [Mycena crocata]|nr:hypothetical protein C8R43DRAFT_1147791 [Mycena crocata]
MSGADRVWGHPRWMFPAFRSMVARSMTRGHIGEDAPANRLYGPASARLVSPQVLTIFKLPIWILQLLVPGPDEELLPQENAVSTVASPVSRRCARRNGTKWRSVTSTPAGLIPNPWQAIATKELTKHSTDELSIFLLDHKLVAGSAESYLLFRHIPPHWHPVSRPYGDRGNGPLAYIYPLCARLTKADGTQEGSSTHWNAQSYDLRHDRARRDPPLSTLTDVVTSRLLAIPRMSHRLVLPSIAALSWEPCPKIDISAHFRKHSLEAATQTCQR